MKINNYSYSLHAHSKIICKTEKSMISQANKVANRVGDVYEKNAIMYSLELMGHELNMD